MRRIAALLAAALALGSIALATGCGGDGAEPGAPDGALDLRGASLVLDFTPNAAHSGIYTALRRGFYGDAGVDLNVEQPGASTDGPKLLAAGKADFAILDIHDLGIAREHGLDIVGVMPIVQAPLGSVIARSDRGIDSPKDLEGRRVGVTGLPSDNAILDSEVEGDGGEPSQVKPVTIGFNAVADLAAGNVDAATAFWNVEGVSLKSRGVPVSIFKVNRFGAPRYPELVLCTSSETSRRDPRLVAEVIAATSRGYAAVSAKPQVGVDDLLAEVPALDQADLTAQMHVLAPALRPAPFDRSILMAWGAWDVKHGILGHLPDIEATFRG